MKAQRRNIPIKVAGQMKTAKSTMAVALIVLLLPRLLQSQQPGDAREWTLEKAMAHALENNLELKAAKQKVEVSKAEWLGAKALPFNPEVEAEQSSDSRYANEGEKSVRLGLSQELEIFGQRWVREDAAKYRWEAAQAEYSRLENSLIAGLREAFLNQLFFQKRRYTLMAVSEFDKEIWDSAQKRFAEGAIRQINLDLTRVEYNRARAEFLKADLEWTAGRLRLNRLLGLADPLVETKFTGELIFPPLKLTAEQAIQLALKHRGDFQAVQFEAKAAHKDLSLARREALPNLNLGIFYEREKSATENLRDDDKLLGFSIGLPLPLLNRNQGGRVRAFANMRFAELLASSAGLDVKAQAAEAHKRLSSAQELLQLYGDLETRLDKDLELVRKAYLQGQIPIEDYLTQKDHFLQAKLDFLDAYKNYSEARSALEQAVGLKWEQIVTAAQGEKK